MVGIVIFPISLIGSLMLIGILGFTPLFTAVIFLRNSVRTFRSAGPSLARRPLIYFAVLGGLFSIVVPYVANVQVNKTLETITTGNAELIRFEGKKLRYMSPLIDASNIRRRYYEITANGVQTEQSRALADLYRDVTGKEIVQNYVD